MIVEGRYAASARAVDLGSAQVKYLDLTSELVILDWIYDATLSHIRALDAAGKSRGGTDGGALRRYCFDLALRVLKRRGFSPLTQTHPAQDRFSRSLQGPRSPRERRGADHHRIPVRDPGAPRL